MIVRCSSCTARNIYLWQRTRGRGNALCLLVYSCARVSSFTCHTRCIGRSTLGSYLPSHQRIFVPWSSRHDRLNTGRGRGVSMVEVFLCHLPASGASAILAPAVLAHATSSTSTRSGQCSTLAYHIKREASSQIHIFASIKRSLEALHLSQRFLPCQKNILDCCRR